MILDLSLLSDCLKAEVYFAKLVKDQSGIELKKIHKKRTNQQNRYVHALFSLFGMEYGYSTEEAKTLIKRELGYTYEKNDHIFLEHTSDMDTKKLTEFIDRFRNFSSSTGLYLPTADEFQENYVEILKQVEAARSAQSKYSY